MYPVIRAHDSSDACDEEERETCHSIVDFLMRDEARQNGEERREAAPNDAASSAEDNVRRISELNARLAALKPS